MSTTAMAMMALAMTAMKKKKKKKQIRLIVLSLGGVLDARKTHTVAGKSKNYGGWKLLARYRW